jgi:hypothetical protein
VDLAVALNKSMLRSGDCFTKKKYIYFLLILLLIFEKKQPQSLKQGLAKGPRAFSRLLLALSVLQMAGKYRG